MGVSELGPLYVLALFVQNVLLPAYGIELAAFIQTIGYAGGFPGDYWPGRSHGTFHHPF